MSYLALARKWRPRTFSQLIGQEHIRKALQKSIELQRLHHAYLFTGTRGVGKTTVARLLAKVLNCEEGINIEPCMRCDTCISIEQGRFIDLIEIDGASRTRVEDTRELLENVQYAATTGRFKIYLIDEVHMLSQHSFNALLKTLEEPPSHVKFLLATTDPQKLPITVLSRCLQFHLRAISSEAIISQLHMILREEGFDCEAEALELIATAAQGSMRDALSLLDQMLAASDARLLVKDVKQLLGYTQKDYSVQIVQALGQHNAHELLEISNAIAAEGGHFIYVLEQVLIYLHQLVICQSLNEPSKFLSVNEQICALATQFTKEDIQLFYQIALRGKDELSLAPTVKIGFEMTLLRMHSFQPLRQANPTYPPARPFLVSKTEDLSVLQYDSVENINKDEVNKPEPLSQEFEPNMPAEIAKELNPAQEDLAEYWRNTIKTMGLSGLALTAVENAQLNKRTDNTYYLQVAKGHQTLFTTAIVKRIEEKLSTLHKVKIKLMLNIDEQTEQSPAQIKQVEQHLNLLDAEKSLNEDNFLQQFIQEFSAEVVKNSIEPVKDPL